jgi:multidrug efflux system membrane fusion protein
MVAQGELLAEIDSQPFEVALEQAQGQLVRDQAQLAGAKLDLDRYQTLFAQDSVAKQQLDQQASLVQQDEGQVKSDQAQVDSAKLQLAYTHIIAPVSGRVGLRQVDAGNMVHASDSNGLIVITQTKPITVVFTLPEDSLPSVLAPLHAGREIPVDAYDRAQASKLASGKLLATDNQIDTSTGSVKLKALFANDSENLFPNQFVNVKMLVDVKRGVIVVPRAAIQQGPGGAFVYLVQQDQTVTLRSVRVGLSQDEMTSIENGLDVGDIVVVDGLDRLRDGAKIKLVEEKASKAPADSGTHMQQRPHRDS